MRSLELATAQEAEPEALDRFLCAAFGARKGRFLREHGAWWHREASNRLVVLSGRDIAGYCALIPAPCWIGGRRQLAHWWLDLFVSPAFRGQGVQSLLDLAVRERTKLLLGFPNALAAAIHRKHGWGVREDLRIHLLPLKPLELRTLRRGRRQGLRALALRAGAQALNPVAQLASLALRRRPASVFSPTPALLAELAASVRSPDQATCERTEDYLRWRYWGAPYTDQLRYYHDGREQASESVIITRRGDYEGGRETLILDIITHPQNLASLRAALAGVISDACREGVSQVKCMSGNHQLNRTLRALGFCFSSTGRFCWDTTNPTLMGALYTLSPSWSLSDSDNDALDLT